MVWVALLPWCAVGGVYVLFCLQLHITKERRPTTFSHAPPPVQSPNNKKNKVPISFALFFFKIDIFLPPQNVIIVKPCVCGYIQMIKRLCRKLGMPRWPYRQIDSINKSMEDLQDQLEGARTETDRAR